MFSLIFYEKYNALVFTRVFSELKKIMNTYELKKISIIFLACNDGWLTIECLVLHALYQQYFSQITPVTVKWCKAGMEICCSCMKDARVHPNKIKFLGNDYIEIETYLIWLSQKHIYIHHRLTSLYMYMIKFTITPFLLLSWMRGPLQDVNWIWMK